jgi:hypothetical protein
MQGDKLTRHLCSNDKISEVQHANLTKPRIASNKTNKANQEIPSTISKNKIWLEKYLSNFFLCFLCLGCLPPSGQLQVCTNFAGRNTIKRSSLVRWSILGILNSTFFSIGNCKLQEELQYNTIQSTVPRLTTQPYPFRRTTWSAFLIPSFF